jgi:signal transduction histidine kinase
VLRGRDLVRIIHFSPKSMTTIADNFLDDIQKVNQIPIVSNMLEVICQTTGLGFAAIARVTEDKWIACSVRDEIDFGLKPGGELKIETTLCSEVRSGGLTIVIDHVSEDALYCDHHTPRMYGFQSYISVPIFLKDGSLFGTLCAIDPRPAQLNNTKTIGLFTMFADLISFHLQSIDQLRQGAETIKQLTRQVNETVAENQQYRFISSHNLAEPLRKLRLYSSKLAAVTRDEENNEAKTLASKINASAQRFNMMLKDISAYSSLTDQEAFYELVDLNKVYAAVYAQLKQTITQKNIAIYADDLPSIAAVGFQIEQLFFHLIFNSIKFSRTDVQASITINARVLKGDDVKHLFDADDRKAYVQIDFQDNGIGIEELQLDTIFHIFSKFTYEPTEEGYGIGLAYCRKIVTLHHGFISVKSTPHEGSTFSVILPVE